MSKKNINLNAIHILQCKSSALFTTKLVPMYRKCIGKIIGNVGGANAQCNSRFYATGSEGSCLSTRNYYNFFFFFSFVKRSAVYFS